MIKHAPLQCALRVQFPYVSEFKRTTKPDHFGQIVRSAVLDDLPGIMIRNEASLLAAHAYVAMQRHVHARPNSRSVDHGNCWFADQRNVAVQLGKAVEEMLACRVRSVM